MTQPGDSQYSDEARSSKPSASSQQDHVEPSHVVRKTGVSTSDNEAGTRGSLLSDGSLGSSHKGELLHMDDESSISLFDFTEFTLESDDLSYSDATDSEEERTLQHLYPDMYKPWFLLLVMGLQETDMKRWLYADRQIYPNELRKVSKTEREQENERERIFGRRELEILLDKSIFANVKPAGRIEESVHIEQEDRVPWVAVDSIRWNKPDGTRGEFGDYEEMGIFIENRSKTPKRGAVITRESALAIRIPKKEISIEVIGRRELHHFTKSFPLLHTMNAVLDETERPADVTAAGQEIRLAKAHAYIAEAIKCLDSANVVGRDLFTRVVEESIARANLPEELLRSQQLIERLYDSVHGEIKFVDEHGAWKGDYMLSANGQMTSLDGKRMVDLRLFSENCKSEVRWESDDCFLLLEVHPRHNNKKPLFTDDQTHSWLLRRFLSPELLTKVGRDYNNQFYNVLADGKVPEFLARYNPKDERENHGQISNLQSVITKFTGRMSQPAVFDIRMSSWIIKQLGNGHIKMLNSGKRAYRFPLPGAAEYSVCTQAWLNMAEYTDIIQIPKGSCGYVETVDRLVYHDLDFVANYKNHGGHDLDDKHRLIWCRLRNGHEFYIVWRTPNSYGEYAIMEIAPRTKTPVWVDATGTKWEPITVTKKNLPPTVHEMKSQVADAPEPVKLTGKWSKEAFITRLEKTILGARGTGQWVSRQIVYYWTMDAPRHNPLVNPETVIDTYQQDLDEIRIALCAEDLLLTMEQLKSAVAKGHLINEDLWHQRIGRNTPVEYLPLTSGGHRAELALIFETLREEFDLKIKTLASKAADYILPVVQFMWDDVTMAKGNRLRTDYNDAIRNHKDQGNDLDPKFWAETCEKISIPLNGMSARYPDNEYFRIMMLLFNALLIYRSGSDFSDNMLYMRSKNLEESGQPSIVDHWIRALTFAAFYSFARCVGR